MEHPPGDHPRAGGEHSATDEEDARSTGPSPRWRGARGSSGSLRVSLGTIPALAGSTIPDPIDESSPLGPSPRWRGAQRVIEPTMLQGRTIPALAGSTSGAGTGPRGCADHPRAGGEHSTVTFNLRCNCGPSPRWRGARASRAGGWLGRGTIPALAGSTQPIASASASRRDHPRAGGEHPRREHVGQFAEGPSPRWRGARRAICQQPPHPWTIPALAGSTRSVGNFGVPRADHPRAGGEHLRACRLSPVHAGPSPRWRGALGMVFVGGSG